MHRRCSALARIHLQGILLSLDFSTIFFLNYCGAQFRFHFFLTSIYARNCFCFACARVRCFGRRHCSMLLKRLGSQGDQARTYRAREQCKNSQGKQLLNPSKACGCWVCGVGPRPSASITDTTNILPWETLHAVKDFSGQTTGTSWTRQFNSTISRSLFKWALFNMFWPKSHFFQTASNPVRHKIVQHKPLRCFASVFLQMSGWRSFQFFKPCAIKAVQTLKSCGNLKASNKCKVDQFCMGHWIEKPGNELKQSNIQYGDETLRLTGRKRGSDKSKHAKLYQEHLSTKTRLALAGLNKIARNHLKQSQIYNTIHMRSCSLFFWRKKGLNIMNSAMRHRLASLVFWSLHKFCPQTIWTWCSFHSLGTVTVPETAPSTHQHPDEPASPASTSLPWSSAICRVRAVDTSIPLVAYTSTGGMGAAESKWDNGHLKINAERAIC